MKPSLEVVEVLDRFRVTVCDGEHTISVNISAIGIDDLIENLLQMRFVSEDKTGLEADA